METRESLAVVVSVGGFAKFGEHAVGAFGVNKGNLHVMGPASRLFVDHLQTGLLECINAGLDVVDAKGEMVKSFAALFKKLSDWAGGVGGFKKFKPNVLDSEEPHPHFLARDFFKAFEFSPERIFVISSLGFDRMYRDTYVIQ